MRLVSSRLSYQSLLRRVTVCDELIKIEKVMRAAQIYKTAYPSLLVQSSKLQVFFSDKVLVKSADSIILHPISNQSATREFILEKGPCAPIVYNLHKLYTDQTKNPLRLIHPRACHTLVV